MITPPVARDGAKHIHTFTKEEPVVSMLEFKGRILIATALGIYKLEDDKLIPIPLVMEEKNNA